MWIDLIGLCLSFCPTTRDHCLTGALTYQDAIFFACQAMWHLKDWVKNDLSFAPRDKDILQKDIHAERCLLICADIANGSKASGLTFSKN